MSKKTPITVAHGDGAGPEIIKASLHIILEAGSQLESTRVFHKVPFTTPQGVGDKTLNVTTRSRLGF